jgi:hypothetical protein
MLTVDSSRCSAVAILLTNSVALKLCNSMVGSPIVDVTVSTHKQASFTTPLLFKNLDPGPHPKLQLCMPPDGSPARPPHNTPPRPRPLSVSCLTPLQAASPSEGHGGGVIMEFGGPKSSFGSGRLILKFSSNFSWYVCRGVKCPNNIRLRPNTCLRGLVGWLFLTQNPMFESTSPM